MAAKMDLVLPCFRPEPDWVTKVLAAASDLRTLRPNWEIRFLLVNDGDPNPLQDSEKEILSHQLGDVQFLSYPVNRGKGHAIRHGFAHSDAPITLYTDLDFPYEVESLVRVAETILLQQQDLAIGIKNAEYYQAVPPSRVWLSQLLRWSTGKLLRLPITDTQCGLKAFSPQGRELMLSTTIDRYLFDLECIFLASRQPALRMKAVPIQLRDGVVFSRFGVRILLQEGRNFLRLWVNSWGKK
ncbi:MAG: glycosyltransferase family 2 protein [Bacteroidota bacterium]